MGKIQYKFKEKEFLNKNPLNLMNKTFSNPNTKLKYFPKGKEPKKDLSINDQHTSKGLHRIWSSQNIAYGDKNNNNWDYIRNPIRNNLYSSSSIIFRAPSVKENRYEISRMMRKERDKKMNYLNNIYNTIMINESKLYRKKLYLTGFKTNHNGTKGKIELKKKYDLKDMNDLNDNKKNYINARLDIKSSFSKNRYKTNLSSLENTLIRYKYLKKEIEENEGEKLNNNFNNKNKKKGEIPTSSTYKTNYITKYSKLKSAKQVANDNSKTNETKLQSLSISKASTAKIRKNSGKSIYFEINKKEPKKNRSKIFLYQSKEESKNNKNYSFRIYNDIEMSRMALELNDLIFNRTPEVNSNLTEIEKIIMRFRTYKEFQIVRLDEVSKQDIKGLEKRIDVLQKSIKKYNQIAIAYFQEMQDYISFLNDEKFNLTSNLEGENNKRFNLYFELEKLVTDTVIKQRELEHLVIIKNFLLQVKFCLIKQPSYFNTMLKEASHKLEIGKLILELRIQPQNQNVLRFMESIPELKEDKINQNILSLTPKLVSKPNSNKFNLKKKSKKYSQIFMIKSNNNSNNSNSSNNTNNNNDKIEKEVMKYWNKKEILIFKTPEDFIELLSSLENKNLRLIRESDYLYKNINILKRDFESISKSDISEEINKDIKVKEDRLKILKEEYSSLNEKYNYLINPKNKLLDSENSKRRTKEGKKGFIIDLYALRSITYYKIIEKYNKKGIFLLERLLTIVKNFFGLKYSEYGINRGFELIGKNELNKILKLNQKNIKNLNTPTINEYTLRLLKLYENICEFIKYKDFIYNSIEKNRNIIHKKKEEIQLQRKMKNSRNIRQLAEEKRMAGIKNIMQKDIRINSLFRKVMDENIVLKNKIRKNKSLGEIYKYKKNFKEREFNFYVNYE